MISKIFTDNRDYIAEEADNGISAIPRYPLEDVLDSGSIEVNTFEELYAQKDMQSLLYAYHRVPFYHVFRYKGGGNIHYIDKRKITLKNDCLLLINRDIPHKYARQKSCRGNMVLFTDVFLSRTSEKSSFLNHCRIFQEDYLIVPLQSEPFTAIVDTCFSMMKKQYEKEVRQIVEITLMRNWLFILLMVIEREHRLRDPKLLLSQNHNNYMLQFKTMLDTHFQTQKQVSFYAKELRLSEKKLSQIVYSVHGISAKTFINEKILLETILLLKHSTLNQGEIAERLGLDFTYFVKFFRKHKGMTPAKYRRQMR